MSNGITVPTDIKPIEKPIQWDGPRFGVGIELIEVDNLISAAKARHEFKVTGKGLSVAVLDTGLRTTHNDFSGRVRAQVNFTDDNNGELGDASDGNGHGTNVGGIIAANADHLGIAPEAGIIPIKVLANNGSGSFEAIENGLQWVLDHHDEHSISAVCMSLGDGGNYDNDTAFRQTEFLKKLSQLRDARIAVVIAAGNDYKSHNSQQGMGYPAILRECISVGAVYDAIEGSFSYGSGAVARSTAPDRITPFSQRLHETTNKVAYTDIFGPGAPVTSSGINGDSGESTQHGTSQATPVVAGVVLLVQEFYRNATRELPDTDKLVTWIRDSAAVINDGDDEHDNVDHTNKNFRRVDAFKVLRLVRRNLECELFG